MKSLNLAWLGFVFVASCFSPSFDSGKLHCAVGTQQCPPGFSCLGGLCWKAGTGPGSGNGNSDLGIPDLGVPDLSGDDLSGSGVRVSDLSLAMTLAVGTPCATGAQCVSGICADGVCCDKQCDGACVACNLNGSVGTCSPLPFGNTSNTLGHQTCANDAKSTCMHNGTCDGNGGCALWPQGTACNASACSNGVFTPTSTCDGKGVCKTPATLNCSPYVCQDKMQCFSSCTGPGTECAPTFSCVNSSCGTKGNGSTCTMDAQCTSGHCADGVCCNTTCTGTCEQCNLSASLGTCTPVSGAAAHGSCPGYGSSCGSSCNGSNRTTCIYAAQGTGCNDGNACTYNDVCNGNGSCAGTGISCPSNTACASYSCNGTSTCAVTYPGPSTACDDGNACTYNDSCNGSGGCAGTTVTCPGDKCITYACNGTSTCTMTGYAPSGTFCSLCHCGEIDCNGSGSCSLHNGCVASGLSCP